MAEFNLKEEGFMIRALSSGKLLVIAPAMENINPLPALKN